MAAKPINLKVHRNKVEGRRKRETARSLCRDVEAMVREQDIRAYAVVGIAADGKRYTLWDTGAIVPMVALPAIAMSALSVDIGNAAYEGMEDDWHPNLNGPRQT